MARNLTLRGVFFEKKIPLSVSVIFVLIFGLYLGLKVSDGSDNDFNPDTNKAVSASIVPCPEDIKQYRKHSEEFIHPLLLIEMPEQSNLLGPIKLNIEEKIAAAKSDKSISDASVYLLKLNTGDWVGANHEVKYNSTGFIRLAMFITYLRISEVDPSVLTRRLIYPDRPRMVQEIKGEGSMLKPGQIYTVKELLSVMMLDQDTTVKRLLADNLNRNSMLNLFEDLGMQQPDLNKKKFTITVREYSRFLHLLYNGSYLNNQNSDYALSLLSREGARKGMMKLLPADIKMIHKFGERIQNNQLELRESGIIYSGQNAYLLTVFTSGINKDQLENTSAQIAKIVFDQVNSSL